MVNRILKAENFCRTKGVSYSYTKKPDNTYRVVLKRYVDNKPKQYSFNYSDDDINIYYILSSLPKSYVNDFADFCNVYALPMYDENEHLNKISKKVYAAYLRAYYNVRRLFDDCMDELREL